MPTEANDHLIASAGDLARVDFAKAGGLVPQVAQDARTGEVLMLGYTNAEAAARSLESRTLWFWSRSKDRLWQKGESSGNTLALVALYADCDSDALLAHVVPAGPTCHTGSWSCFEAAPTVAALSHVLEERVQNPSSNSYTTKLLNDRNLRLKKLGEEAAELAVACADGDKERAAAEAADLAFHALVACRAIGVSPEDILVALAARLPGAK